MDNIYKGETIQELVKKDFIIKKNKVKLNTYNVFLNKKFTDGNNGILVIYAPWCESCVISKICGRILQDYSNINSKYML